VFSPAREVGNAGPLGTSGFGLVSPPMTGTGDSECLNAAPLDVQQAGRYGGGC